MTRRKCWVFFVAVLAAMPARALAADPVPTVVVRARSLDSLAEDLKYLAGVVGQQDMAGEFIKQVQKLPGLDFKKPFGAYGYVMPGIVDSGFAVLLPVSGEKELLELLGVFGFRPEKNKDGVYTLSLGFVPFPIHFRFAHGYAYVTVRDKAALDPDKLLTPDKMFPAGQTSLLALSIRFDQIPTEIRQIGIGQIEMRLPDLVEQKTPGESEAQHKLKLAVGKELGSALATLIRDCKEISLQLDLDRKTHAAAVQLKIQGAPGSELAKAISDLGKSQSPFASVASGSAAVSMGLNLQVPEAVVKQLRSSFEEGIRKDLEKEANPAVRDLFTRFIKAVEPTLNKGRLQAGLSLSGPTAAGRVTGVLGVRVENGTALGQAVRDIAQAASANPKVDIKLDHAKVGPVTVHQLNLPKGAFNPPAEKMFGHSPMYFAFGPDAAYVALGESGLDAIKQTATLKPGPAPVAQIDIAAARVAALVGGAGPEPLAVVAKTVFQGADKDNDRLQLRVEGGAALTVRLEAKTTLLKFLYEVGQKR